MEPAEKTGIAAAESPYGAMLWGSAVPRLITPLGESAESLVELSAQALLSGAEVVWPKSIPCEAL